MEILRWVWFSGLFFVPHKVSIRSSPQTGAGQEAAGGEARISLQQALSTPWSEQNDRAETRLETALGAGGVPTGSCLTRKDLFSRSASSIKCHMVLDKSLDLSELQIPHLCISESGLHLCLKVVSGSHIKYKFYGNAIGSLGQTSSLHGGLVLSAEHR